jgi:hypothetical protein
MVHPFFDTAAFPWQRPEAVQLRDALVAAFHNANEIDTLYRICGGSPGDLALNEAPSLIWAAALDKLVRTGALRKLCARIAADPNCQSEVMQAAIRNVMNAQPAVAIRIVSDWQFVLDRENLREQLEALAEGVAPVLVIRGRPGSGKSHSRLLFLRVAEDSGAKAMYLEAPLMPTVNLAIKQLFAKLGSKESPTKDSSNTTYEAWCQSVGADLLALAEEKDLKLWIAVDDLGIDDKGASLVDPEIRQFWIQLAQLLMAPQYQERFRLMLIDYPADDPLPTKWHDELVGIDAPSDADVQPKHVAELLQAWLAVHKKDMIPDEITKRAASILAAAEAPPASGAFMPCRLQRIHDELKGSIKDLSRGL